MTDLLQGRTGTDVLVLEVPPRHGKSLLISQYLPAWFLGRYPDRRVILTSYGAEFARSWGRKARDLVVQYSEWFGDVRVNDAQSAAVDWETNHGGGMITAGVGGPVVGRGADLLIIDDPMKNAEEAMSETIREKQWDWWQSTLSTRREPGAKTIVIQTRWHQEDLIGKLLKASESGEGDKVTRLRLPAIAEADDPLGRHEGVALWPERWSLDKLKERRLTLGSFWWSALYQQRPTQHGDAEFPERCFGPAIYPAVWPDRFEAIVMALDPSKGKDAKHGDYSAIVILGLCGGKVFVEAVVKRAPVNQIVADAIELAATYQPMAVAVEVNQFQELLLPEFDRQCRERGMPPLPLYPITNTVNKLVRIRRLGAYLERDQFRFRPDRPGVRLLIQQLREFPLADFDDACDSLEMGMRTLQNVLSGANQSEESYETVEVY